MDRRRRYLIANAIQSGGTLPSGYKECEYIESNGNQFIDTGIKGGLDTLGVETKVYVNNSADYYVLGNFNQRGQCGLMRMTSDTSKIIFIYYIYNTATRINVGLINTDITFSNKNGELIANNIIKGNIPNNTAKLKNSNLFAYGTSISVPYNGSGRIYYIKVYSDLSHTDLIRSLIPCLDNNNVPCMYDTVSKTTFYNAGTGTFLYQLKS